MVRYIATYRDVENHRELQFVPLDLIYTKDTPGFTHRVVIDHHLKDWLAKEYNPSAASAEFFFKKHPKQGLNESLGQHETVNICKNCNTYPAESGGICQPCIDYEEHTEAI